MIAGGSLYAQQDKTIDSLTARLNNEELTEEQVSFHLSLADLTLYSKPEASLTFSKSALEISQKLSDPLLISRSYYRVGSAYWSMGNLPMALDELQKSMPYLEGLHDYLLISQIYMRVGAIYAASNDYTMSMVYYNKAIDNFNYVPDDFIKFAIYNNMGKALLDVEYLDSAGYYFGEAIKIKDNFDERFLPILLFNIANLKYKQGDPSAALEIMRECDSIAVLYNDIRARVRVAQLTSEILLQNGELEKSLASIEFAVKYANESKVKELIAITHATYSKVLEASGKLKESLDALKLSKNYTDSIQSIQVRNKLELFKFDESEREKEKLRKQQEIAELKAKNQSTLLIGAVIILAILLIMLIYIYRNQLIIRKQNHHLSIKNNLILDQKNQLDILDDFKTKVMAVMAHDIRGPLHSIYGIVDLLDKKLMSPEDIKQILPDLNNKLHQVGNLLDNILDWSRRDLNDNSYHPVLFNMAELIQKGIEENKLVEEAKDIKIINDVPTDLVAYADPNLIAVVIRNLFINAIKYSHKNGTITFQGTDLVDKCQFRIIDEGVGMDSETLDQLFSYDTKSKKGTANELGTGFGLIISKDFVTMNRGTIEVNSVPNEGTTFTITLPKKP